MGQQILLADLHFIDTFKEDGIKHSDRVILTLIIILVILFLVEVNFYRKIPPTILVAALTSWISVPFEYARVMK